MDTQTQTQTPAKMNFLSLAAFKAKLGISTISIVKNPNTGKLFANTGTKNYKVQAAIDLKKELRFMYTDENTFDEGCLVNVAADNVVGNV